MNTPVLLVVYRRPEAASRVLEAIAQARPRTLFVAADGPASEREAGVCAASRAIVQRVNWPCDLRTDFADENMGPGVRIASAVSWVLAESDRLIVLEDDCLPSARFFGFCETVLDRFAEDSRVLHVSGESYQPRRRSDRSYLFSKYPLAWGWATWRRAWKGFDQSLATWPAFRRQPEAGSLFDTDDERAYWYGVFDQVHQGKLTDWDYAWIYACMTQGLSIHPAVNLVTNIGWGEGATHTIGASPLANRPIDALEDDLRHPVGVVRDREADMMVFDVRFPGGILKKQRTLPHQAGRPLRWLRRQFGSRSS